MTRHDGGSPDAYGAPPASLFSRSIAILGATGSVGASTCALIADARRRYGPEACPIEVMTARSAWRELAQAALALRPERVAIQDAAAGAKLREALSGHAIDVSVGDAAVVDAARGDAGWVMAAIVGAAGLEPTLAAIERGAVVALANKEALVCAGALMMERVRASGAVLLPVDSEHNAIFQVLDPRQRARVRAITLTASGGPFRTWSHARIAAATPKEAIAHPTWSMGPKISVDSATLMNKGLELIEARHLFDVAPDKLAVLMHPQSSVHGLVEYVDGSVLAQMGPPDMTVPIAHALAWPDRIETPVKSLDLGALGSLTFEPPDETRFPSLTLARYALTAGGHAPAVLNAANEVAVSHFLDRRIGFLDIPRVVEEALSATAEGAGGPTGAHATLADVLDVDRRSREAAEQAVRDHAV